MSVSLIHNKVNDVDLKEMGGKCCNKDDDDEKDSASKLSCLKTLIKLLVCFVAGIIFGIALQKTAVFEPKSIRYQMVFRKWIMLKMFLAATATGQLVFAVLSVLPITKERFENVCTEYVSCFVDKGILTSVIGPALLGCGMTVSGACPGMVLVQVGSWTPNAIFTLIGALLGALCYGLVAPYIHKFTRPKDPFKIHQVHSKFRIPFIAVALPMAVILCVIVFLLEYFIYWQDEIEKPRKITANIATTKAWPPYVGGILVGLMQIPIIFAVSDTIGGSSSYVTVVSQWVIAKRLQEKLPYLAKKRCGVGNWWQVVYVTGAIVGGAISSLASDTWSTAPGVTPPAGLFGGMLMIIGARFASGCTSGHGLSGLGLLAWLSLFAVPCMFGGGIATAFAMRATGALDDFTLEMFDC